MDTIGNHIDIYLLFFKIVVRCTILKEWTFKELNAQYLYVIILVVIYMLYTGNAKLEFIGILTSSIFRI